MKRKFKKLDDGDSVDIQNYLIDKWKDIEYSEINNSESSPNQTLLPADHFFNGSTVKHSSNTSIVPAPSISNVVKKIGYELENYAENKSKTKPKIEEKKSNINEKISTKASKRKRKKSVSSSLLQSYLADTTGDQCFVLNDGNALKNLRQLSTALLTMPPEVYNHHVTPERNDFFNWVAGVIGDKTAANSIHRSKSRYEMAQRISARVNYLEKQTR